MGQKAIFFDVDGTLMDTNMEIPPSVSAAMAGLKRQGHLSFVCSGRTKVNALDPRLVKLGFDGWIFGCGTMVEYGEEELLYYRIPEDAAVRTVETLRKWRLEAMLEGKDILYVDDGFNLESLPAGLREYLRGKLGSVSENYGSWEFSKAVCKAEPKDPSLAMAMHELSDLYAFQLHEGKPMVEIVPKGFTKGSGIAFVSEHLGIDRKDTFCFGDSVNDIEMLHAVGTGIVMGNGEPAAKGAADYVTNSVAEDGIYNALQHFGLI